MHELKEKLKKKEKSNMKREKKLSQPTSCKNKCAKAKLPLGRPKQKQAKATGTNATNTKS